MKLIINIVVLIVIPLFVVSALCAFISYGLFSMIEKKYGREYVNRLWAVRFVDMIFKMQ